MLCEETGIHLQLTPYTPQKNGVSERKKKIHYGDDQMHVAEKNLPKKFWAEAANTSVFSSKWASHKGSERPNSI